MSSRSRAPPDRVGEFKLGETIGKGGFGTVIKGISMTTGQFVAIKQIPLSSLPTKEDHAQIDLEIGLLRKLNHRNIVKYIDKHHDKHHYSIILEFVEGGSLLSVLKNFTTLPESLVTMYITQVLAGLAYLHAEGVIHRDIKASNILVTANGSVKLADFGVATLIVEGGESQGQSEEIEVVGTPYWMAPEVIEMSGAPTNKSDIWSVGCTVIELLTGSPPYFDLQPMPALFRIVQDDHPALPAGASTELESFLLRCFAKDPAQRWSAEQLLRHPWLKTMGEHIETKTSDGKAESLVLADFDHRPLAKTIDEHKALTEYVASIRGSASATDWPVASKAFAAAEHSSGGSDFDEDDGWDFALDKHARPGDEAIVDKPLLQPRGGTLRQYADDEEDGNYDDLLEVRSGSGSSASPGAPATDDFAAHLKHAMAMRQRDVQSPSELPGQDSEQSALMHVAEDEARLVSSDTYFAELRCVERLDLRSSESELQDACQHLIGSIAGTPTRKEILLKERCLMPMVDIVDRGSLAMAESVISLIIACVRDDVGWKEKICLVGILPIMIRRCATIADTSASFRQQVAALAGEICSGTALCLQLFIGCGGLRLACSLLGSDYGKEPAIVRGAVSAVHSVVLGRGSRITNDEVCRLAVQAGLLPGLSKALRNCVKAEDALSSSILVQLFASFARADEVVCRNLAQPAILADLMFAVDHLASEPAMLIRLLGCVKLLTMLPETMEAISNAGAIDRLVAFIDPELPYAPAEVVEMHNLALMALFYLCKVNRQRQEMAAIAGAVPRLQQLIFTKSTMDQFALDIFCALPFTSKAVRALLWKHHGLDFFLELLNSSTKYWCLKALDCLVLWLLDEQPKVEAVLQQPRNVAKLVGTFREERNAASVAEPFQRMLAHSERLARAMGVGGMVAPLLDRLAAEQPPGVCVALLKILLHIVKHHRSPSTLIQQHNLVEVVQQMRERQPGILVSEMLEAISRLIQKK